MGDLIRFDFIARKRLPEDDYERPIAREEDRMLLRVASHSLRSDVETSERLAGARHSSNEADDLAIV